VGEKAPNAWGLYDMHGNVWEWVEDYWQQNYDVARIDGSAWVKKPRRPFRVVRGGSWRNETPRCRSATRACYWPDYRRNFLGFRLSMSVTIGP
jgi:formylglycine-generating enzyme required for sulfatase activity